MCTDLSLRFRGAAFAQVGQTKAHRHSSVLAAQVYVSLRCLASHWIFHDLLASAYPQAYVVEILWHIMILLWPEGRGYMTAKGFKQVRDDGSCNDT
jgi:hypothetical protein